MARHTNNRCRYRMNALRCAFDIVFSARRKRVRLFVRYLGCTLLLLWFIIGTYLIVLVFEGIVQTGEGYADSVRHGLLMLLVLASTYSSSRALLRACTDDDLRQRTCPACGYMLVARRKRVWCTECGRDWIVPVDLSRSGDVEHQIMTCEGGVTASSNGGDRMEVD